MLSYTIQRKIGRIINIASAAGTRGIRGEAAYCASKHGIVDFIDAVAQEVMPYGILVTTVCPGGIDTPLWFSGDSPYLGDLDKLIRPEEIARLVAFLLRQPAHTILEATHFFNAGMALESSIRAKFPTGIIQASCRLEVKNLQLVNATFPLR